MYDTNNPFIRVAGYLLVWITCEPITYFMLNRYDRMTIRFPATQYVLRLFKVYTKRLNNPCQTICITGDRRSPFIPYSSYGPPLWVGPSGSTWNECMTYSISYNSGSSILKGRPKGVPYKCITGIHFSNFPDSGS